MTQVTAGGTTRRTSRHRPLRTVVSSSASTQYQTTALAAWPDGYDTLCGSLNSRSGCGTPFWLCGGARWNSSFNGPTVQYVARNAATTGSSGRTVCRRQAYRVARPSAMSVSGVPCPV